MAYTIKEKFDIINEHINEVGKESVNYIAVADPHVDEYLRKDENGELRAFEAGESVEKRITNFIAHLEEAVRLANENDNIDFFVVLGDVLNAYSIRGKDSVLDTFHRSLSPLKACKKPVLLAFGNHDDNGFQTLNSDIPSLVPEWLISDSDWKRVVLSYPFGDKIVFDKNYEYSKYFYLDLEDKKTRLVMLDTMDMRKPFDENGVVTEIVNRLPRFWYTNEQLDWLCNQVFTAPDGWDYIMLSHMGIANDTSDNCKNGENLRKVFKAFQSRGNIAFDYTDMNGESVSVSADFGGIKEGKITMYNFGHQHAELVHFSDDLDLWQVATGCENAWGDWGGAGCGNKGYHWVQMKDRTEGTENET
ncbi:MAG: metallophosphoesterase, partial [Clostridia bacterium]|nr:metallophosphoesterase [Clostridia bacterium]